MTLTAKPTENRAHEKIEPMRLLLKAKDAAATLAISPRKLWELTNCGTIKAVRLGRSVRYATTTLEEFIADQLA